MGDKMPRYQACGAGDIAGDAGTIGITKALKVRARRLSVRPAVFNDSLPSPL